MIKIDVSLLWLKDFADYFNASDTVAEDLSGEGDEEDNTRRRKLTFCQLKNR